MEPVNNMPRKTTRPPEHRRIGHMTLTVRDIEVSPVARKRAVATLTMDYKQTLEAIVALADGLRESYGSDHRAWKLIEKAVLDRLVGARKEG